MLRFNIYGIYCDFADFIRCNKGKFVAVVCVALLGCGLGINSAFGIDDINGFMSIKNYNIYLMICGSRGFFGYFVTRITRLFFVMLIAALLSYRLCTACVNLGILFFYSYMNFRMAVASVILLKITFLPAAVICVFPFTFIYCAVLCCVCTFSMSVGIENRCVGRGGYFVRFGECCRSLILPFCSVCLLAAAESLLACLLTIGVSA